MLVGAVLVGAVHPIEPFVSATDFPMALRTLSGPNGSSEEGPKCYQMMERDGGCFGCTLPAGHRGPHSTTAGQACKKPSASTRRGTSSKGRSANAAASVAVIGESAEAESGASHGDGTTSEFAEGEDTLLFATSLLAAAQADVECVTWAKTRAAELTQAARDDLSRVADTLEKQSVARAEALRTFKSATARVEDNDQVREERDGPCLGPCGRDRCPHSLQS